MGTNTITDFPVQLKGILCKYSIASFICLIVFQFVDIVRLLQRMQLAETPSSCTKDHLVTPVEMHRM